MTSQVMVRPRGRRYLGDMSMTSQARAVALYLALFLTYSLWVVSGHGLLGFLSLAGREPWALQLLLDLVTALVIASAWMVRDARARGIRTWPFTLLTLTCGSIGLLGYLVWRGSGRRAR